jgi:hypothetical protein
MAWRWIGLRVLLVVLFLASAGCFGPTVQSSGDYGRGPRPPWSSEMLPPEAMGLPMSASVARWDGGDASHIALAEFGEKRPAPSLVEAARYQGIGMLLSTQVAGGERFDPPDPARPTTEPMTRKEWNAQERAYRAQYLASHAAQAQAAFAEAVREAKERGDDHVLLVATVTG